MRVLYIISLVLTIALGVVTIYYLNEYESAKLDYYMSSYSYDAYSYDTYDPYAYEAYDYSDDVAREGSTVLGLFVIFYILLFSFTLKLIKTITAKVMSIIGLSLSGIVLFVCLAGMLNPGDADFDGVAVVCLLFGIIMMAFCIVNLVQSFINTNGATKSSDVVIDDL